MIKVLQHNICFPQKNAKPHVGIVTPFKVFVELDDVEALKNYRYLIASKFNVHVRNVTLITESSTDIKIDYDRIKSV